MFTHIPDTTIDYIEEKIDETILLIYVCLSTDVNLLFEAIFDAF